MPITLPPNPTVIPLKARSPAGGGPGGFTGVTQQYTYARLYNLYLDPKEQHSYLTRKLAYNEAFLNGIREHLRTYRDHPPKQIV